MKSGVQPWIGCGSKAGWLAAGPVLLALLQGGGGLRRVLWRVVLLATALACGFAWAAWLAHVRMADALGEDGLLVLLRSEWHEERLLALFVMVRAFREAKDNEAAQKRVVDLYLANTEWVNNWDLVDSSAGQILGGWLYDRDRRLIFELSDSGDL